MKRLIFLFSISLILVSCKTNYDENYTIIDCPQEIKTRAFKFAEIYRDSETEYRLGGQDPCRAIQIDCSGLIIMTYKYAIVDTNYSLLVSDMTAAYIAENASTKTESPQQGDLVFMGESDNDNITHIAIFDREENGQIYFIDSTEKDSDGDGVIDINGVTERNYASNDSGQSPVFRTTSKESFLPLKLRKVENEKAIYGRTDCKNDSGAQKRKICA